LTRTLGNPEPVASGHRAIDSAPEPALSVVEWGAFSTAESPQKKNCQPWLELAILNIPESMPLSQLPRDFRRLELLDHVTDLDIIVTIDLHTAFKAFVHFTCIVFEALER
jgi:hypothetical protein